MSPNTYVKDMKLCD
ncbi:DUF1240 domain-containing protein, partial [Photorhabdus aegyptia]|nr:DUF1240 domain-containing protein [Photorhabdus aegyptia]